MFKIKFGDFIIIGVVLLVAGVIYGVEWLDTRNDTYVQGQLAAQITVDGRPYKTVNLTKKEQVIDIQTKYGHNTLKVFDYGIQMVSADCPRKISMQMGFKTKPHQQIICIPNRVLVEVINPEGSQGEDELDAVI
ncbi:NusG domain II-containing protein [Paenibacillus sp. sgz500958]|uniref:NusG domain II-containing protein n=1 Tax=Paenibacillus sp. sgz500958 TaxID=3242475 RepID=UPI0036D305B7